MTDRELLERAAKAADVFLTPETLAAVFPKWEWDSDFEPRHLAGGGMSGTVVVYSYSGELSGTTREEWNPLDDDGDALRLAVALRMTVRHDDADACTAGWCGNQAAPTRDGRGPWFWKEWNSGDASASTRRAIVTAAAQMADGGLLTAPQPEPA